MFDEVQLIKFFHKVHAFLLSEEIYAHPKVVWCMSLFI